MSEERAYKYDFDLNVLHERISENRRDAKNLIRKIISIFAIRQDIVEAEKAIRILFNWYEREVLVNRTNLGDNGSAGFVGKSLFNTAVLRICRAFDMASEGRSKIDFRPILRTEGLEEVLDEIFKLRNKEIGITADISVPTEFSLTTKQF